MRRCLGSKLEHEQRLPLPIPPTDVRGQRTLCLHAIQGLPDAGQPGTAFDVAGVVRVDSEAQIPPRPWRIYAQSPTPSESVT